MSQISGMFIYGGINYVNIRLMVGNLRGVYLQPLDYPITLRTRPPLSQFLFIQKDLSICFLFLVLKYVCDSSLLTNDYIFFQDKDSQDQHIVEGCENEPRSPLKEDRKCDDQSGQHQQREVGGGMKATATVPPFMNLSMRNHTQVSCLHLKLYSYMTIFMKLAQNGPK